MIARLAARLGTAPAAVKTGIGDDCAVVEWPANHADIVLTSDPVIEGVHFASDAPPEHIGHKAVGRVLSDFAAMGAEPLWLLINLVATPETSVERLEVIYDGAHRLCRQFQCTIIGGDLARGPLLELHVFGVGTVPGGSAILRGGAQPGDALYVTGALGGSLAKKHLVFLPRIPEGRFLRENRWTTAMMDVSDGLAADLRRLASQSRVGAELELARIPVSEAARRSRDGRPPEAHALCDGEDFELLFTISPDRTEVFEKQWRASFDLPVTRIGRITAETGLLTVRDSGGISPLTLDGYQHFISGQNTKTQTP